MVAPISRVTWVHRATLRLLWRDDFVGIGDALELANAMWERRPTLRLLPPEEVIDQKCDGKADDDQMQLPTPHLRHDRAA
jgi:hypothetical protein